MEIRFFLKLTQLKGEGEREGGRRRREGWGGKNKRFKLVVWERYMTPFILDAFFEFILEQLKK